jgi:hypothetical protein
MSAKTEINLKSRKVNKKIKQSGIHTDWSWKLEPRRDQLQVSRTRYCFLVLTPAKTGIKTNWRKTNANKNESLFVGSGYQKI